MHKLLQRQLRKEFGSVDAVPSELRPFLERIDQAYDQADHDRRLIERAMDLTSEELMAANAQLRNEHEALERRVKERTRELRRANRALEREVEERERTHRAVQSSEEKYRTLFEESLDAICVLTVDGRLLDLNQAAVEGLGFASREQALDQSVLRFYVQPAQRAELLAEIEATGFVKGRELELVTLDGRRIVVLANSVGLRDETGRITQIRATLRDITHEQALQQQLLEAQKMEAVGRLAGGVAHEFNNLLTTVAGNAELLSLAADPGSEAQALVEEIQQATKHGAQLTERLLAFGRQQAFHQRSLDFNHVVSNVLCLLRRLLGDDIEIVTRLDAERPTVLGDFAQLEQVLVNLSINARDAMPEGGTLEFTTRNVLVSEAAGSAVPPPGDYVLVSVRDTGTGIDETIHDRIFEPFFTTRDTEERPGLGLAAVHGIVRQAGGHVKVSNRPRRGTVFDIYWPVEPSQQLAGEGAGEGPSALRKQGAVVLVVDDDDGVRSLTCRVLKKHGYTALEASGGDEALDLYSGREGEVNILVSDVVMPGMQGPELARRLRSRSPDLKVLLMSGYSESMGSGSSRQAGDSTVFLKKPFSPSALIAEVEKLLAAS